MKSKVIAVVALCILLVGCDWTQAGFDGGQTGASTTESQLSTANVNTMKLRWSTVLTSPTAGVLAQSGPLVYAAGSGSTPLVALNTSTGAVTWSRSVDTTWSDCGGSVISRDVATAPVVAGGHISDYLDQHGNPKCPFGGSYNLYFGTETLDAATGATVTSDVTESCDICGDNPNVVITDSDPVEGPDGNIYRVTITYPGLVGVNLANPSHTHENLVGGTLNFTGADAQGNGPDLSTPALTSTAAFVTESNGHLVSVKLSDSSVIWSASIPTSPTGIRSTPSTDGTSVYVTVGTQLLAFNASTGAAEWTATLPEAGSGNAPAVAAGRVFVRTAAHVLAFNTTTGSELWRAALSTGPAPIAVSPGPILPSSTPAPVQLGSPSIANGVVYVGTQGGQLVAFDTAGVSGCNPSTRVCTPLFSASLGGPTDGSRPIIFNGTVAIAARTAAGSIVTEFGM